MAGEIRVVDYDPAWVVMFAQIRARVDASLGDLADAIEHVGSTAVPGLAAKPIIDIDVRLTAHTNLGDAIECLEHIGYHHRGDLGIEGRKAFDPPDDLPDQPSLCVSSDCVRVRAPSRVPRFPTRQSRYRGGVRIIKEAVGC